MRIPKIVKRFSDKMGRTENIARFEWFMKRNALAAHNAAKTKE